MVKVFFEIQGKYAELIAFFSDEETYEACSPALEELAKAQGFNLVTESVEHNISLQDIDNKLKENG